MKSDSFCGVVTALVTPFKNGAVDFSSLREIVHHQIKNGIFKFIVNGTTAESPTLDHHEVKEIYRFVRNEVGEKSIIVVGTGSNCTRKTIEFSKEAESWGADGLLVVTPYYNKPPQEGLVAHFSTVAQAVRIPLILYNVPSRTITAMTLETVGSLSKIENIIGVKEASGDIELSRQILKKSAKGFFVTSGDDFSCVELAVEGGRGVISVVSHLIPAELIEMMNAAVGGDARVKESFLKYSGLLKALYSESNPIGVKMALFKMGIIDSPEMRLPLVAMSSPATAGLVEEMKKLGLV
jgi:4-hydroxy-tetrahydrodipicolinate synthase